MNKEIVITILLDACKYDYKKYFRFEKYSGNLIYISKVDEPFGFESGRPAMWAGINPETSNVCTLFGYMKNSPLKKLSFLQRIAQCIKKRTLLKYPYLNIIIDQVFVKFFIKLIANTQMRRGYIPTNNLIKNFIYLLNPRRGYTSFFDIPHNLLKYFWFYEDKIPTTKDYIKPTLFDAFRDNKKKYLYLQTPIKNFGVEQVNQIDEIDQIIKKINSEKYDLVCMTIGILDELGHHYGPNDSRIKDAVEKIDKVIYDMWNSLREEYEKVTIIAHGDHGMVEITNTINIWKKLQSLSVKMEKDYLVFLDSPMARFWFFNEKAKREVTKMLKKLDCGRILIEKDSEKYRIRFKDNRYWDLIWLANPGTLIFPNFLGWYNPVKGMHGYAPECEDNKGLFVVITNKNLEFKTRENLKMIDMFPTICDIMNLPIPKSCEGESIIKNERRVTVY